ncbi:hypothetical protein ARSEF4850_005407 [Beauveria asiatica]
MLTSAALASQVIALAVHHRSRSAVTYADTFLTGVAPRNTGRCYSRGSVHQRRSENSVSSESNAYREHGGVYLSGHAYAVQELCLFLLPVFRHLITANVVGIPIRTLCGHLADRSLGPPSTASCRESQSAGS